MEKSTKATIEIYDFIKLDINVTCPKCKGMAIVKGTSQYLKQDYLEKIKITCSKCGFNKKLIEKPKSTIYSNENKPISINCICIGIDKDPFFNIELWLKINCEENIIWAYNFEHLTFLKEHIESKIKQRDIQLGNNNKSLTSRLPKWMTSKKNRKLILKKINDLYNKK